MAPSTRRSRRSGRCRPCETTSAGAPSARRPSSSSTSTSTTPAAPASCRRIRTAPSRSAPATASSTTTFERELTGGTLPGRPWLLGEDFTLADCAAAPALFYADKVQPLAARHPACQAYLDRLRARPSYARVLDEAAPYFKYFPTE